MAKTLILSKPDDYHIHLRDGALLSLTVPALAKRFARALIMPNLDPPVLDIAAAREYRTRIMQYSSNLEPLMTLYLTDATQPALVAEAKKTGLIHAFKLYPQHATTLSDWGVSALEPLYPVFEAMERHNMVLSIHGEVSNRESDIFDREAIFIETQLLPLTKTFPNLRIVLEHISTQSAVDFILDGAHTVAATITAHHLLLNRNDLLSGKIHPHYYCLPILKRATDQQALIRAAISGHPRFFLGTDSAPHLKSHKESDCGCAGIYTGHSSLELYAEVFEQHHALDRLENFASRFGADFYQLPHTQTQIHLVKEPWTLPHALDTELGPIIPMRAGTHISWRIHDDS